uniref:Uncharacterized protein n=1 Tax=Chrysotila carterae TaxID=13221 RepID=A0A7S4B0G3_CHRCT
MRVLSCILRGYAAALEARPIAVKASTSAVSFGLADFLAQAHEQQQLKKLPTAKLVEHSHIESGFMRTARNAGFGFCFHGPWIHMAWGRRIGLERFFPGTAWSMVITRIFLDQVVSMPIVYTAFLSWPALTTGQGIEAAAANVRHAFWPAVSFAWSVWPMVHIFNFKYVPLQHRLLVTNVVALGVFSYATFVSDQTRAAADLASPLAVDSTGAMLPDPALASGIGRARLLRVATGQTPSI